MNDDTTLKTTSSRLLDYSEQLEKVYESRCSDPARISGGALLSILKQYIEQQRNPEE
jgi:hypothetical protein